MVFEGKRLVAAMCIGQVGNLLPHVTVPAVMARHLIPEWKLTASEAGLMASSFAIGYMLTVPILTTLTDRRDARSILLIGSLLCSLATLCFGLFADGLASAAGIWALAGIGFAGAYMPGLKALTDRLGAGDISRSVTFYTSSFSLGVGLSFLVAQLAADALGWRVAFYLTALGPLAMVVVCLGMAPVQPIPAQRSLLNFAPVLRNRAALSYILGYGAHCFELYALRTWVVAFWAYMASRYGTGALLDPITVSVLVAMLAMPSSLAGNEGAIRFGRHGAITVFMCVGGVTGLLMGALSGATPAVLLALLMVYTVAIFADSGALTSGMTASAEPAFRGTTMALHSTVGFGMSALGAWGVGWALDYGGGIDTEAGWRAAFVAMAAGGLLGPLVLWWSRRASGPTRSRTS